ncbi:MAG: NADPH-dependent F420 reductase [Candidatus Dormibacteria bacterium]
MQQPSGVAILGGTGPLGRGLALRLAQAGVPVVLGSRDPERARAEAARLGDLLGSHPNPIEGVANEDAASRSQLVLVTVPYSGQAGLLAQLGPRLKGKVVVSTAVAMDFSSGGPRPLTPEAGSAAQEAAAACPEALLVGAFHTVSADNLLRLERPLAEDVLVCSDAEPAREQVLSLVDRVPGLRGVNAGQLANCALTEALTPLLLRLNRLHRARAGVRITGIP